MRDFSHFSPIVLLNGACWETLAGFLVRSLPVCLHCSHVAVLASRHWCRCGVQLLLYLCSFFFQNSALSQLLWSARSLLNCISVPRLGRHSCIGWLPACPFISVQGIWSISQRSAISSYGSSPSCSCGRCKTAKKLPFSTYWLYWLSSSSKEATEITSFL